MERKNDLSDHSSKQTNHVPRINHSTLFKLTFCSSFLMLVTVYLIAFYTISFFLSNDGKSSIIE